MIISLKSITKDLFSGDKKWTLGPIDLEIEKNSSLAIIGPSGSGKSTLLHLIGSLEQATKGKIIIANEQINNLSEKSLRFFRAKKIGFVFQDFFLFPEFTLLENVQMPLLIAKENRKTSQEKAKKALDEVGLIDRQNHFPCQLSGGQRQRGAIARAIAGKPEIIIADEPTGNLDQETGKKIITLLKKLQKNYQATLLFATHDENLAKICEKQIKIIDGRLKIDLL